MLRANQIEFYVNEAHYASGLPPVFTQDISIEAVDYIRLNDLADPIRNKFRKMHGLPEAIGRLVDVQKGGV